MTYLQNFLKNTKCYGEVPGLHIRSNGAIEHFRASQGNGSPHEVLGNERRWTTRSCKLKTLVHKNRLLGWASFAIVERQAQKSKNIQFRLDVNLISKGCGWAKFSLTFSIGCAFKFNDFVGTWFQRAMLDDLKRRKYHRFPRSLISSISKFLQGCLPCFSYGLHFRAPASTITMRDL